MNAVRRAMRWACGSRSGTSAHAAIGPGGQRPSREGIDWSQLWNPGPVRVFTAEELARAGQDAPSRTLVFMVTTMGVLMALSLLQAVPQALLAQVTGLLAGGLAVLGTLAKRLWWRPERRLLNTASWGFVTLGLAVALVVGLGQGKTEAGRWLVGVTMGLATLSNVGLWFLTVYRSEQIAARLRELAERERAADMARQLATAQIQPHFLFNTLASLQHWVQTGDTRAGPLLADLTAFLRATLPLFNRSRLRLGDEAEAVRRYLAVMQLRLGDRLRFSVQIDAAAAELQVPPGLLLTLVENAVEHGVQGSLHGADIDVQASTEAGLACIVVRDTGPGCAPGAADGLGLSNSRTRLQQAFGAQARLLLAAAPGGGCEARIEWPLAATGNAALPATSPATPPAEPPAAKA